MQIPARRFVKPALAVLALSLPLTACGGSDEERPAKKAAPAVSGDQRGILGTVEALQTASRNNDGRGICADIFTPQLVRSIEKTAKRSCVEEVSDTLVSPDAAISLGRDIKVTGLSATATISEQNDDVSTLFLLKQDGEWRINRVVARDAA